MSKAPAATPAAPAPAKKLVTLKGVVESRPKD